MKLIARSSRPASAGMTRSSSSRPSRGVRARIRRRSSSPSRDRLRSVGRSVVEQLDGGHAVVAGRQGSLVVISHEVALAPRTTTERCSSGSIAHFAAKRARRSSRTSRSPASGSVRRRKSSAPRRQTTSGATIRAFGVRSSASHDSPTCEGLHLVRDHPVEVRGGVRPVHGDVSPGRGLRSVTSSTRHRDEGSERVQEQSGAEGAGGGVRPRAAPARPVPDREVAGAARRRRSLVPRRPRRLGLPRPRRGRAPAHPHVGRARRPPEGDRHAGHPLRHALEPLRRRVHRRSLVGDPRARRAAAERALRDRTRRGGLHGERPGVVPRGGRRAPRDARRRRAARRRSTAGRSGSSSRGSTSGRARSGCARSSSARPTRPASGSATATTTTPIPGRSSATPFEERRGHANDADPWQEHVTRSEGIPRTRERGEAQGRRPP